MAARGGAHFSLGSSFGRMPGMVEESSWNALNEVGSNVLSLVTSSMQAYTSLFMLNSLKFFEMPP